MPAKINRRSALKLGSAAGAALGLAAPAVARSAPALAVLDMRVQQLERPIGIDSHAVRLSWRLQSNERNVMQRDYRVCVASSPALLQADRPDLWDSGQIESSACFDVAYKGRPLRSRERAFWRVTILDTFGRRASSDVSYWEMGLLEASDWAGQWLACETPIQRANRMAGLTWVQSPQAAPHKSSHLHMSFDLPAAARLSIHIGSSRIATATFDGKDLPFPYRAPFAWGPPPVEQFDRAARAGRHVVTVAIPAGDGRDTPNFAVSVRAEMEDGSVGYFNTDRARLSEQAPLGWHDPDYDASGWLEAQRCDHQPQSWPGGGAFMLRKSFKTRGKIRSARLYATALGAYELRLNGKRVGDALLAPECTDFRKRAYYCTHDVTDLIIAGDNAIGAWVADGWYGSYSAPAGRFPFGDPPLRFSGQLEILYENGDREIIASDASWAISKSPIGMAEIYNGEDYDARQEQPGWDCPAFATEATWTNATLGDAPQIIIGAMEAPPIRVVRTLKARTVTEIRPGVFVFDFGQNFAGLPQLRVRGAAGTKVVMRFAEMLKAGGEIDQANLRAARATDTYILRGEGDEVYVPRFTYHGFRWVELTGFPGRPTVEDLQALVIHSDLDETSLLDVDNPLIQALWHNALWSQRSNFMGIPTDCPQRDERLGWMGDANVFWDAAAFNMNVAPFTRRFMRDVRDWQAPNGAFPDFAPRGGPLPTDATQSSPGWADAGVILPWTSFLRSGDTAVIDENWQAMQRYIANIMANNPDHVWANKRGRDYADWLALDAAKPGDPTTPKDLVGTATYKHSVDAMAQMAAATGRNAAHQEYAALSRQTQSSFARAFIQSDGTVGNGSQTGYILALNYDLVPAELRSAAFTKLAADIRKRGTLLSTGFLGTPGSLDCLAAGGFNGLIYDLLLRTEFPSWGYMVSRGATTIWERWNGDAGDVAMNSFNHYALGAVSGFIMRRVAGIAPVEPGFRTFRFDPIFDARVPRCKARYDSVLGPIKVEWERYDNRFSLEIEVPPNSRAIVRLPIPATWHLSVDGSAVETSSVINDLGRHEDATDMTLGAGRFTILAVA